MAVELKEVDIPVAELRCVPVSVSRSAAVMSLQTIPSALRY